MGGRANSVEEDDNMEEIEEEDEEESCVVCLSKIKSLTEGNGVGHHHDNLLSKNLDVIFLLKNLMQVPDVLLKNNLRECGNPVNWGMSLCENCVKLSDEAKYLHLQIIKLESKFKSIQQSMLDKVRISSESESLELPVLPNDKEKHHPPGEKMKKSEFWRKARYFVKNFSDEGSSTQILPPVNQVIEEDNSAKSQKNTFTILIIDKQGKISVDNEDEESASINCKVERGDDDNANQDDSFEEDTFNETGDAKEDNQMDKDLQDKHKEPSENTKKQIKCKKRNKFRKKITALCDICGERFPTLKGLSQHLILDHDKMLVSCYLCGMECKDDEVLKMHLLDKHKEEKVTKKWERSGYWYCQVTGCELKYTRPSSLGEHWRKMHKEGKGEVENWREHLECHKRKEHGGIKEEKGGGDGDGDKGEGGGGLE